MPLSLTQRIQIFKEIPVATSGCTVSAGLGKIFLMKKKRKKLFFLSKNIELFVFILKGSRKHAESACSTHAPAPRHKHLTMHSRHALSA